MAQPIRTTAGKQLIESLDAMIEQVQRIDLDEESTFTRLSVRTRIEALKDARDVVYRSLSLVESDAVTLAATSRGEVIGIIEAERLLEFGTPSVDDPSDITLPFVRDLVRGIVRDHVFEQGKADVLSGRAHL